jgi:peptidyl-prolyl cis-trans isomerase D
MFDFVRRHTRIIQFTLVLLIFPSFVFFGVQGYQQFNDQSNVTVASVDGVAIKQAEWDAAHRNYVERVRAQMPGVDAAMFDRPEMKRQVLEDLVRERVLAVAARKQLLLPGDERLQRLFVTDPQYAALRNPDGTVRKELLAAQGMSSEMFAERLRQDIAQRQVLNGVTASAIGPATAASGAIQALLQRREVQIARFDAAAQRAKLTASDEELKAFYDDPARADAFQSTESADIELVVLDLNVLQKDVKAPEADLRKYYDENLARFSTAEERRASHILIAADKSAAAGARAKAKAAAEAIAAEVKAKPESFAAVAKAKSQDPGSAGNGGDLDWFGRGAMTKPFEDAVFAMKKGEVSGVVESDFGFHVIQLTGQRGGERRAFESVRGEIEAEYARQEAQKRYAETAEQFSNLVEQSDDLQAVADKLKLPLQKGLRVTRTPAPGAQGALASARLLEAVFNPEVTGGKRNTDPIEVAPNQLAAAHVRAHQPVRRLAFDEVKEQVRAQVLERKAQAAAKAEGEARLAEWRQKPDAAALAPAVTLSRAQTQNLPRVLVDAVLAQSAATLPAWLGVEIPGQGYAVVKLNAVRSADPAQVGDVARLQQQYAQAWGQAEADALYDTLKARLKVRIDVPAAPSAAGAGQ